MNALQSLEAIGRRPNLMPNVIPIKWSVAYSWIRTNLPEAGFRVVQIETRLPKHTRQLI